MRANLVLYTVYAIAIAFLLSMSSFSKYAPTNHQSPTELPPPISHEPNPAAYIPGTIFAASNGIRYASHYVEGQQYLETYSTDGKKIFDFGRGIFLAGEPSADAFLASYLEPSSHPTLRRVSPNGETLWQIPEPGLFPMGAVSLDGKLFFADTSGLYAFSSQGEVLWHWEENVDPRTASAVEEPWHFIVVGRDATLYRTGIVAFKATGERLWASHSFLSVPIFGPAGQIYAPSGNNLLSIDSNGQVRWRFVPPGSIWYGSGMTPVLGKNGDLYVTAWTLYCVSPEGAEKWRFHPDTPEEYFDVAPEVGPDGTLYLASRTRTGPIHSRIYALRPDGQKKWVAPLSSDGLTAFRYTADGWMWRADALGVTGFAVEQPQ